MKPWIDGKSVDREIAEETPCPECGSTMHYEPRYEQLLEGEPPTYRAFCVCDNEECGNEIEF